MSAEPATITIERDSLEADVRDLNAAIVELLEIVFAEPDSSSKPALQALHPVLSKLHLVKGSIQVALHDNPAVQS
jgi:hypothetical protein